MSWLPTNSGYHSSHVAPEPLHAWHKLRFTVCTAAGKTTFIKNLFASYTQDPNLQVNDVPGSTSKDTFVQHPDKLLTEIVVRDERNMLAYHYRVQDTPGQSCHSYSCISLWHEKTHVVAPHSGQETLAFTV